MVNVLEEVDSSDTEQELIPPSDEELTFHRPKKRRKLSPTLPTIEEEDESDEEPVPRYRFVTASDILKSRLTNKK